jgi:hypothetical protein
MGRDKYSFFPLWARVTGKKTTKNTQRFRQKDQKKQEGRKREKG